ncbi:MAG: integration host factor [Coriobacteriales bacterium]|jgi:DNA uptake protein ComE-like DNA-binding protein|nr:integration host factor [Coriobacteriales bacterium]
MALPELTPEQRQEALKKAAAARSARAQLRQDVKSGKLSFADVLKKAGDPVVDKIKVVTLIESLPGYGKAKAAKLLAELDISDTRRVKGLGDKQKAALLERLG